MQIGLFDIWKRILQSLGIIPPDASKYFLKDRDPAQTRVKPPEFDSSKQVRVLLFRELNGQDRRLLFDSKSVRKRDPSASPGGGGGDKPPAHLNHRRYQESSIEKSFKLNDNHSKEFVYEWQKSSPDEQMLREMIFGSVSISYQGTTLKVHTIRLPFQIMLSVVFAAPPIPMFRIGEQEAEESGNWTTPTNEININKPAEKSDSHLAHSVPVNVPSRLSGHYCESRDSDSDSLQSHDGYSSLPTIQHLTPEATSAGLPRSSSYNSLQRRLMRNKATSIELGLQKPDDGINDEYARGSGQKRVKLGLSIVINLDEDSKTDESQFCNFVFSHISLIEGHMMHLKDTVVRAYLNRRCFVQLMFEGAKKFQQAISDLYTAPRLQNPEWLTIISSPNHRHLSYAFLEKFAHLLKQYDKKETHFFVSTLLTAVLTHHLSWVPSVIPTDSKIQFTQTSHKHTPCWVDLLAKSRPYNPHWVQLSDLYGALGHALKLSKTVVKGHKKDIISKFLQVLSYFIRCSDICEQLYERIDGSDTDSLDSRLQTRSLSKSENSSLGGKSSSKLPSEPNSVNASETCVISCCTPKPSLPQNLCSSHLKSVESNDADSVSDTSKDTCDVSITPTEEQMSNSSVESIVALLVESKPVPIVSCDTIDSPSARDSTSSSLGYVSLRENLEPSKRFALQEQSNFQGLSSTASSSRSNVREGKENNPHINITMCSDNNDAQAIKALKSKKCCACDSCPCYDKPLSVCHFSKDLDCSSPKIKECESIEEGYHSMEEPHSPCRVRMHLSEMLKQYENWHPEGLEEVPLPELQHSKEVISSPYKSFGWSLMADITNHYLTDFCLQGLNGPVCEDEIRDDLIRSANTNVLGEPVSEAVCIIADTDRWSVQLLSSNFVGGEKLDCLGIRVVMSSLVSGMCEAILNMFELGIPPESCIIYLEDRLQELYFRSQMLSDYLRSNSRSSIPLSKVSNTLNVDMSDMPLLMSVATTHSPDLFVHSR